MLYFKIIPYPNWSRHEKYVLYFVHQESALYDDAAVIVVFVVVLAM